MRVENLSYKLKCFLRVAFFEGTLLFLLATLSKQPKGIVEHKRLYIEGHYRHKEMYLERIFLGMDKMLTQELQPELYLFYSI